MPPMRRQASPEPYHAMMDDNDQNTTIQEDYRGFSTSIAGSFQQLQFERVDACSVVCCGILQSDRDRFVLTGTRPPRLTKRLVVHVMFPICLLLLAMDCALHIPNAYWNQVCSTTLVVCIGLAFVWQCCKGRWKRERVRKELLLRKYKDRQRQQQQQQQGALSRRQQHHYNDQEDDEDDAHEQALNNSAHWNGQSGWDMFCAHSLLGCYSTDMIYKYQDESTATTNNNNNNTRPAFVPPTSLSGCLWNALTMSCCGACGCYLQVCGMCALAQEARDVERYVPPVEMDYITFEPVLLYAPALWQLRNTTTTTTSSSGASFVQHMTTLSKLSRALVKNFCIVVAVVGVAWSVLGHYSHVLVALGAFVYAFGLLFVVFYPRHRLDVSADALIKYFISGFVLATTLAVSWELVVGLAIRVLMSIVMALSGVDVQADNEYSSFHQQSWPDIGFASISYRDYLEAFGNDNPFFYVLYLFVSSYLVAALIEEVSKYFGHRMVDHVDVWTQPELDRVAAAGVPELDEDPDDDEEEAAAAPSGPIAAPPRTLKSIGASVTITMVAVAIGFSCLEDLIYIFIYNEYNTVQNEFSILMMRALLPVHPIAAAIQSIGVCRRDLEKDKNHQLGRIILPAVLFHGSFDFLLLFIDFVSDTPLGALVSLICAFVIVVSGLVYFFKESRAQRERLERVDRMTSVDQSSLL